MKHFRNKVKDLGAKPLLSMGIFFSLVLIGSVGIIAVAQTEENLDQLLSTKNNNKLTATMWDTLVGEMKRLGDTLDVKEQWISNADGIYYSAGNIGIGAAATPTAKQYVYNGNSSYGLYLNNGTGTYGIYVLGTGKNYFAGNVGIKSSELDTTKHALSVAGDVYLNGSVGIGTQPTAERRLWVQGTGFFSGPLYANTPTATSLSGQVATKGYVDSQKPTITMYVGEYDTDKCSNGYGYVKLCKYNNLGGNSQCNAYCASSKGGSPNAYPNVGEIPSTTPSGGSTIGNKQTMKYSYFANTIIKSHSFCSLNGVGGRFNNSDEDGIIINYNITNGWELYINHMSDDALNFAVACMNF